ncbi:hypothetical protein [Streptomyces murinus]
MVSYGKRGRVAYVTLDRPAVLNAMSLRLPEQLSRTRADFGQGEDICVAARPERATARSRSARILGSGFELASACDIEVAAEHELDLVSEVVPAEDLDACVDHWSEDLVTRAGFYAAAPPSGPPDRRLIVVDSLSEQRVMGFSVHHHAQTFSLYESLSAARQTV